MKTWLCIAMLALPTAAQAQTGGQVANPIVMVIVLAVLALAPFIVIMLTSFVKISVVLSIVRNALGTQQVPPNQIITGLAFVLTIFIMVPVGRQMYQDAGNISNTRDIFSEASVKTIFDAAQKAKEPLRRFLSAHSHVKDRELFMDLAVRLEASSQPRAKTAAPAPASATPTQAAPQSAAPATGTSGAGGQQTSTPGTPAPGTQAPAAQTPAPVAQASSSPPLERPDKNDFQVLIPAFVTSQLKEAFEVGFLVFVPFIVVDMVIANILLAMGMQMLSPTVISLPFKLLLFVLVDGWFLIVRGLVLSYT
jgi:type III secretion protein R